MRKKKCQVCGKEFGYIEDNPYSKNAFERKKYCSDECGKAAFWKRKIKKLQLSN